MPPKKTILPDALGYGTADKRIDILRRIASEGSISKAARAAGISYKGAWHAVETLTNLSGVCLVEKVVGGAGGGGARLTQAGRELIQAADQLQVARSSVVRDIHKNAQVSLLGPRTSMRNQLLCKVAAIEKHGATRRVTLVLSDDTPLHALLTRESVELLGLLPGLTVLALCKATAVTIKPLSATASPGTNVLKGKVIRRSANTTEVTLELTCGQHLVGITPPGLDVKRSAQAQAMLDDMAVVIAVPG